jgi:SAM-dependent methyltransferase
MHARTRDTPDPLHCCLDDSGSKVRSLQRAMFVPDLTQDVLRRSGIACGMRVLDLGCGTGDTSLLIATLLGPFGPLVGVDRSAKTIDLAQRRATVAGQCYWARFIATDLDAFIPAEPFDAFIVRLKQLRLCEPAAAFWQFSPHVRRRARIWRSSIRRICIIH